MNKSTVVFVVGIVIVLLLLASTMVAQVNFDQVGLIKTFGKTERVVPGGSGLCFKLPWPVQRLVTYGTGWQNYVDPQTELMLKDKQNILLTLFCRWRVNPQKAAVFNQKADTLAAGEDAIRKVLQGIKGDVIGKYEMNDMVNTDVGRMRQHEIETVITERARAQLDDWGIEVASVGIDVLGLSENVSKAVIALQKAERQMAIKMYQTEGESDANTIKSRAQMYKQQILDFANRRATLIRAEGELAAAKYYQKFDAYPQLAMFLRSLDGLKPELENRTVILLNGDEIPALRWFKQGMLDFAAPVSFAAPAPAASQPASAPATGK